jgi:LacI family transcriptional regulator
MTTYLETMRETGRTDLAQVVHVDDAADAHSATARLLDGPTPPTAVFAAFDALALEVLHVVRERGLTASDLAVVGYDNLRIASHPGLSLSSVDQLGDELGRRAVRLLLERIGGRTEAKHEMTTPQLLVRASSST